MKKGKIHIGTSGWSYKHWKGTFYPADTTATGQLQEYLKTFNTVELNNPFYRTPEKSTYQKWYKNVPEDFIYAVKVSRYITHQKKLIETTELLKDFIQRASALQEKLGPFLFQLPPSWKINLERLGTFLKSLPKGYRYTFEFRNHSWYTADVYELLRKHNCAFCIYELAHHLSPIEITADFIYVRLHGPGEKYQGSYTKKSITNWSKRCQTWAKQGKDVYIYFDNDQMGYSAFNAQTLQNIINT